MIGVLTICNYSILANVVDFRTYGFLNQTLSPSARDVDQRMRWDRNSFSRVDREHFIYVRGLAINFLHWLNCNFDVYSADATAPTQFFLRDICGKYLLSQACAILHYKKKAEAERLLTIPFCKFRDIKTQLHYLFGEEAWYGDWTTFSIAFEKYSSLAFGETIIRISRKESPSLFNGE